MQYNLQLEKICKSLHLGELIGRPRQLSGGFLHKMYAIETSQGKYAIKTLNPHIMLRPTARQNFIRSEQIASIVVKNVSAIPANKLNDVVLHELDHQFYLVFNWIDGTSLRPYEITNYNCNEIGAVLANIHMTDFSELDFNPDASDHTELIDWHFYLSKGQENKEEWVTSLLVNLDKLYEWNEKANRASKLLEREKVISHRDLDPKNVLWSQGKPFVIDWESAGYINPAHDLAETAVYWAEDDQGNIDREKLTAFLSGYQKNCGRTLQVDWKTVLENGFLGKLGWLEYSFKRSLWIECSDKEEQQLGTVQVTETIKSIIRYADNIPELEKVLYDIF